MPALETHWVTSDGRPQFSAMYHDILRVLGRHHNVLESKYQQGISNTHYA